MKRFNFLSVVIALVLVVAAVGCTTMRGTEDEYYEMQGNRASANRVYVEDPYRGTVVLERDPLTGRYYEVGSYGSYGYGNRYDSRYYDRRYYGTNRNSRNYRGNSGYQTRPQPQPTPEQHQRNRDEARKKVLGN